MSATRGPYVVFDVLARLLRRTYALTYARNVTDVDDKINDAAAAEGAPIGVITERYLKAFHADLDVLGVAPPDVEPRVTQTIPQIIRMIERLIAAGHAYAARRPRAVRRAEVRGLRPPVRPRSRGDDRRRARRGGAVQEEPRGFRPVEAVAAGDRRLGQPVGTRPARLAHRVLGHGGDASRRHDRHPRRRRRSRLSASRERSRAEHVRARRASALRATGCTTVSCRPTARRCRSRSAT